MTSVGEPVASATATPVAGDPTAWRIEITGELDLSSISAVRPCFDAVLERRPRRIVVGLGGLRFMDSTGIGLLLEAAQQVAIVELANPSSIVRDVVSGTGLGGILRIGP